MSNSNTNQSSQQLVDTLFASNYFIQKFQHLQLQTYNDLSQSKKNENIEMSKKLKSPTIDNQHKKSSSQKKQKTLQIDTVITEISELILTNFKQMIYKETNTVYENKLSFISLSEEIENIKQSLNKMGQATSFAISNKTLATHESETPQKYQNKQKTKRENRKDLNNEQNKRVEASLFMDADEESSIDLGISRKNLTEDRIGSFSFMNSFLNENKISAQEEEIINERINASISKIQSSIDDRISQLQKEFTRRIEQVMKTMGHFIEMVNQNDRFNSQNPFQKDKKKEFSKGQAFMQGRIKKQEQNQKLVSSKSTIIVPQNKKSEVVISQVQMGKSNQQQKLQPNRSGKLASFFGLGRLKTVEN